MSRRPSPLAAVPLLFLGLAGCSSDPLTADEVATSAEDALEQRVGVRPDIACPGDVPLEVGAEARCVLTAGDDPTEYGVTVIITGVDEDGIADLDVRVDAEPVD